METGPLPSPWVLAQYDDVVPGAAERITAIVLVVLGYPWGLGMLSLTLGMLLNESRKRRSGW